MVRGTRAILGSANQTQEGGQKLNIKGGGVH